MIKIWVPKFQNFHARLFPYIIIGAVLVAATWVATDHVIEIERQQKLADSAQNANNLASFFEERTLQIIRYSDSYLKSARREYVRNGGVVAVLKMIVDVPLDHSIVSHITVIDETGSPLLVSGFEVKPGSSARDRDYFKFQKENGVDQVFISLPHRGRNSGKLLVRLARRITMPDGSFGGVIFAAVEVKRFTDFFNALNLGPKSSATLVGTDKRIVARSGYGRLGPGQDISGSRFWRELAQSPKGLYEQRSVVDGVTRYYAYRKLLEFPLIVAIGVSAEDISAAAGRFEISVNTIAFLVTIVIFVMTTLICREIAIRRRLQASEAQFRSMIDNMPAGIYLKDMAGRYLQTNRQYDNWFSASGEDVGGKTPFDIHPVSIAETAMEYDRTVRRTGHVIEHEELITIQGIEHTFLNCKFPIQEVSGRLIGTGAILSDITGRKRTEQALRLAKEEAECANKSKSEFLARMSHDFRTPLNAIIGFSEVMKDEKFGPVGKQVYADYARDIFESGHHLLALVEDLLDLSRIEAGQYVLKSSTLVVSDLAEKMAHLFEHELAETRTALKTDIEPGLPQLRADRSGITQMLQNLLSNAIKFTPDGGEIKIEARSGPNGLTIAVKDNGIGIEAENFETVLQPFSQVKSPMINNKGGVGLGLSIVKTLIELHGGHIILQSTLGVGTTVTLCFPRDRLIVQAA